MKPTSDPRSISDQDLILVFYGEHDDPQLAAMVADDAELSQRFAALSQSLGQLELLGTPPLAGDYGASVWAQIQGRLSAPAAQHGAKHARWSAWLQPRFSLAGLIVLVVALSAAFLAGQYSGRATAELAAVDSQRLLNRRVAQHLASADLLLTQLANDTGAAGSEADWATELLRSNRLYRHAAGNAGHQRLAGLLDEIEPLLIELAHSERGPVDRDLLLRLRVVQQRLNEPSNQI